VGGVYSMPHPEMEFLTEHKQYLRSAMHPVYPSTEMLTKKGISSRVIHKAMQQLFLETKGMFAEVFPKDLIDKYKFLSKAEAIFNVHFPQSTEMLAKAQFRLKFEEDRKSTRLNSSHVKISYAVFCLKKKIHQNSP